MKRAMQSMFMGQQYNYSAGESRDAAKALGMREVDQEHKYSFVFPTDDEGKEITDPQVLKERQKAYVDDRADVFGKFECDRMCTFDQFKNCSAQIDVLSWPDTEGN